MIVSLAVAVAMVLPVDEPPSAKPKQQTEAIQPDAGWKKLGRSIWIDPKSKHLYLRARVVLREGYLEHLMCSKGTKEHEAILATDAVPHEIHAALLATGAEPGKPA